MPTINNSGNEFDVDALFGTFDDKVLHVPDASSGDGILRTTEQCKTWADSINCDVIQATEKQLFIDIDTKYALQVFEHQIKLLKKHFWFSGYRITESKQGPPHYHIVVELNIVLPLLARIALQACLGSDPTRELLSVRRALDDQDNVIIFFERQEKQG